MTELERYIAENREAFDSEPVPAGSRDRFMAGIASEKRERRVRIVSMTFSGIAAACAAVLFLMLEADMSRRIERYHTQIAEMANEIMSIAEKEYPYETEMISSTIRAITDEAIPLEEQLPDELTIKEKGRILDEYYSQKYSALQSLMAEL